MLHRLYLSAFWLLAAFGILVTGGVTLVQVHDHVVVAEDTACFLAAQERALSNGQPAQRSGGMDARERTAEPFDPDAYLAKKKQAPAAEFDPDEYLRKHGRKVEPATKQRSGSGRGKSSSPPRWDDIEGEEVTPAQRAPRWEDIEGEEVTPTPVQGQRSSGDQWDWSESVVLAEPSCNVKSWAPQGAKVTDLSRFYSTRAWNAGTLTFRARGDEIALSALSFLPMVVLALLRRWWRWVRTGSAA